MEFRESTWAQQLLHMRMLHGSGAEATERSLPNYPAAALREVLRQSQHPHNIEPLLLTLARPVNAPTRLRFASVGGELVLIQKVLSKEPVASDLQVAVHGQVIQAADGILYPTKEVSTPYEIWVRVEMLEVIRVMVSEGIVKSLVPEMQLKLVDDLLQLTSEVQQHELIRLYAFLAATAVIKHFHTLRPVIVASKEYLPKVREYLAHVLQEHSSASIFLDPFEHIKALHACVEALYLISVGHNSHGDPNLKLGNVLKDSTSSTTLDNIQSLYQDLLAQLEPGLAPVLSLSIEQACSLLHDMDCFKRPEETPAKQQQQQPDGERSDPDPAAAAAKEEQQDKEVGEQSFEENWQMFLKTNYEKDLMPSMAKTTIALAAGLLQLTALQAAGVSSKSTMPDLNQQCLQQMAAYEHQPLLQSIAAVLAAAAGYCLPESETPLEPLPADTAIVSLPGFAEVVGHAFAKRCSTCCKLEEAVGGLKRCGQCGCAWYCSTACQKEDWKAGHKGMCKQLAEQKGHRL